MDPQQSDPAVNQAPSPESYMAGMGLGSGPSLSQGGDAMELLKPILSGQKSSVVLPRSDLAANPTLHQGLIDLSNSFSMLGLAVENGPSGEVIIYDPSGTDVKQNPVGAPPSQPPPQPAQVSADPSGVTGQEPVNAARAKSLGPQPPSSSNGFLSSVLKRAF